MSESDDAGAIPLPLLTQTLARFVDPAARLTEVTALDVQSGMSGASVRRYTIRYTSGGQDGTTSLVTKVATRNEWNVLRELNAQRQPNVPFAYALDEPEGDHLLLCMQDVGDVTRPTSLDPITELELEREAAGLASIHAANFERAATLAWLPKVDRDYLEGCCFSAPGAQPGSRRWPALRLSKPSAAQSRVLRLRLPPLWMTWPAC